MVGDWGKIFQWKKFAKVKIIDTKTSSQKKEQDEGDDLLDLMDSAT